MALDRSLELPKITRTLNFVSSILYSPIKERDTKPGKIAATIIASLACICTLSLSYWISKTWKVRQANQLNSTEKKTLKCFPIQQIFTLNASSWQSLMRTLNKNHEYYCYQIMKKLNWKNRDSNLKTCSREEKQQFYDEYFKIIFKELEKANISFENILQDEELLKIFTDNTFIRQEIIKYFTDKPKNLTEDEKIVFVLKTAFSAYNHQKNLEEVFTFVRFLDKNYPSTKKVTSLEEYHNLRTSLSDKLKEKNITFEDLMKKTEIQELFTNNKHLTRAYQLETRKETLTTSCNNILKNYTTLWQIAVVMTRHNHFNSREERVDAIMNHFIDLIRLEFHNNNASLSEIVYYPELVLKFNQSVRLQLALSIYIDHLMSPSIAKEDPTAKAKDKDLKQIIDQGIKGPGLITQLNINDIAKDEEKVKAALKRIMLNNHPDKIQNENEKTQEEKKRLFILANHLNEIIKQGKYQEYRLQLANARKKIEQKMT